MKLIFMLAVVALAGCSAELNQNELNLMIEKCSEKGSIYKITAYSSFLKPIVYCKDGTAWR